MYNRFGSQPSILQFYLKCCVLFGETGHLGSKTNEETTRT
jgi:hypothetical protein